MYEARARRINGSAPWGESCSLTEFICVRDPFVLIKLVNEEHQARTATSGSSTADTTVAKYDENKNEEVQRNKEEQNMKHFYLLCHTQEIIPI